MDGYLFYSVDWISYCCYLFCCSSCPIYGHQELPQIGSFILYISSHLFCTLYLVVPKNVPGTSCIFLCQSLEPSISIRNSDSFNQRMGFRNHDLAVSWMCIFKILYWIKIYNFKIHCIIHWWGCHYSLMPWMAWP